MTRQGDERKPTTPFSRSTLAAPGARSGSRRLHRGRLGVAPLGFNDGAVVPRARGVARLGRLGSLLARCAAGVPTGEGVPAARSGCALEALLDPAVAPAHAVAVATPGDR